MNDKSKLRINKKDVLMTQHLGKWTDTKQDEMLSWCGLVTGEKSSLGCRVEGGGGTGLDWSTGYCSQSCSLQASRDRQQYVICSPQLDDGTGRAHWKELQIHHLTDKLHFSLWFDLTTHSMQSTSFFQMKRKDQRLSNE